MIDLRKFGLVAAVASGGGTRDESLIASAWEARRWVPLQNEYGRIRLVKPFCSRAIQTLSGAFAWD